VSATLTQISIKLHAHGLNRLTDPNWTGLDLFYLLKEPVRNDRLLFETKKEGFLYHLGLWIFDEYLLNKCEGASGTCPKFKGEYLGWYLEDLLDFLKFHGADMAHRVIQEGHGLVERIDQMYDSDEAEYFKFLESSSGRRQILKIVNILRREFVKLFDELRVHYAEDFAQRIFHDREICGFISSLIVMIGYPGYDDKTGEPELIIERIAFPEWAKKAVHARDRGKCANCGAGITMELEADGHIDHIVPLAAGGSNDLVNLQLLCKECNLKKGAHKWPVRSSIPKYLQRTTR